MAMKRRIKPRNAASSSLYADLSAAVAVTIADLESVLEIQDVGHHSCFAYFENRACPCGRRPYGPSAQ